MRYVNIKDKSGNELSVRVDQIVAVKHGVRRDAAFEYEIDKDSSIVYVSGVSEYNTFEFPMPKAEVFEKMGLHLTSTGDWV